MDMLLTDEKVITPNFTETVIRRYQFYRDCNFSICFSATVKAYARMRERERLSIFWERFSEGSMYTMSELDVTGETTISDGLILPSLYASLMALLLKKMTESVKPIPKELF